jgi:hypothetical protein
MQDGWNILRIEWPSPDWPGPDALPLIADALERGREADLYPVYGEIHALSAAAQPACSDSLNEQENEGAVCLDV